MHQLFTPKNITRSFEYPIYRCTDSIKDLACSLLWVISLDARSGYHQISVLLYDREKIYLFTPCDKKKAYIVIPFGPKNVPVFYTAIM